MQASNGLMRAWLIGDDAATAIEYALLAAGIAMAIITVVTQIGTNVLAQYAAAAAAF